jgi:chromosome segregation ATPase
MLTRWFDRWGYVRRELLETATAELQAARAQLTAEVQQAQGHIKKATRALEQSRRETAEWKASASEADKRIAALERELKRARKFDRQWEREQERDVARARQLEELRTRLETAQHELAGAREHLALVEVKLDIVEGAANVLDARIRAVPLTSKVGE